MWKNNKSKIIKKGLGLGRELLNKHSTGKFNKILNSGVDDIHKHL